MKIINSHFFTLSLFLLFIALPFKGSAQYSYKQEPLLSIIKNIEKQTSYRFLYRNALITNIHLDIDESEKEFFDKLGFLLQQHNLNIKVDNTRNLVFIFRDNKQADFTEKTNLSGQVIDDKTGERLPYAVVTWYQNQNLKGLSTNENGDFSIQNTFNSTNIELTCSYTGYKSQVIQIDLYENQNIKDLTCRLTPDRIDGNQIIVIGTNKYENLNQHTAGLVDIGNFSPMGETSSISALQALPSVSLSPILSNGLEVRGSPPDGFTILIDDVTVYNQSHLFGLVDSFNDDVLKRAGFYYDITPAKLQGSQGGTLSLVTKTGSLDKISGSAGISNSSFRFSLDGPIQKGKSSWLLSARKSYMNNIDWFNNSSLTKWGLNVDRPKSELPNGIVDLETYLVKNGKTNADFYDIHGKLYFESKNGNRLILSGYFGADENSYSAERIFRDVDIDNPNSFYFKPVATKNDWRNGSVSAKYTSWINDALYSSSVAGFSIYRTDFNQDDFMYKKTNSNNSLNAFIFPFTNQSVLNDISFQQNFEFNTSENVYWSMGASYNYYLGEYAERSFDRPSYFSSIESSQFDIYSQTDITTNNILNTLAGARVHYYANGNYLKFSPRLKFTLFPESPVYLSAGFSRTHQFKNQVSLSNSTSSDIWVLADKNQKPSAMNNYSAGLYFDTSEYFYAQVEAYIKQFENLRLHEMNTFSLSDAYSNDPWYTDNKGNAKGLEFLTKLSFSKIEWSNTLAISDVELSNPLINNGNYFNADWDRKFRYKTTVGYRPVNSFTILGSWTYATGTPNKLAIFGVQVGNRLGSYSRFDVSARYKKEFDKFNLSLSGSIINLFDTKSAWYRDLSITLDQVNNPGKITGTPVDVYDIGFQPSFNLKVGF